MVVPNQLGAVNQALQTLVTATTFREGLAVAGIILNQQAGDVADQSSLSNRHLIQRHAIPPLLAEVEFQGTLPSSIDWMALASQRDENSESRVILQ